MSEIADVSDTARWVATFRARESSRPDALFHDPFADRLAGERGRAMTAETSAIARNGWSLSTRTKLIDDLIADCVDDGCDRVLNLAAGLDARPYRLAMPDELIWVEADLPAMIDEKQRALAGEQPRCELIRRRRLDPDTGRYRPPSQTQKDVNTAHARLRGPGERANVQLKNWKILRKIRSGPSRATTLVKAIQTLILIA